MGATVPEQYAVERGVHSCISGAGARLRPAPRAGFEAARTRAWAAQGHFLPVQIRGAGMRVTPVARAHDGRLKSIALDGVNGEVPIPIAVRR